MFLSLHFLVLGFTLWNIVKADHLGFTWIQGKVATLDKNKILSYHYKVYAGLILMVLTGFMIFWPMREFLLSRTQFYVKMAFVLTLFINSFVIGKLQVIATKRTFASLTPQEKVPLFLSGAVSTTCWILTIVAAFFLIPE